MKIPGYLARARARPALVKRGASGPCPKKCFKIFPHRARVHGMCIFSWISFFYFISIFNICSVVCMPFDFFFVSTRSPIFYWGIFFILILCLLHFKVQKWSPHKSTFPRSRVTLYNHEIGLKSEKIGLFEHTSAFKMIIFYRFWWKPWCLLCLTPDK